MLADFICQHDFDIVFAQEVMSMEVLNVRGTSKYWSVHMRNGHSSEKQVASYRHNFFALRTSDSGEL